MYGEVLSEQAAQELDARIRRAERARRVREAGRPRHSGQAPRREKEIQRAEPLPRTAKAANPR